MPPHFRDFDTDSGFLELKACRPDLHFGLDSLSYRHVVSREPEVPFIMCSVDDYQARKPFDIVVLSQSPRYTPATSDPLIDVVREYIEEV